MLVRRSGERLYTVYHGCTCSSAIRDGLKFSRASRGPGLLLAAEICNLARSIVSGHLEGKSTLEENRKKERGLCTLKKVANHLRSGSDPLDDPHRVYICFEGSKK